jgi:hypothetical protein
MVFIPIGEFGACSSELSTIVYCLAPEADRFIRCGSNFHLLARGSSHRCATGCVAQVISEEEFQQYYNRFTEEETLPIDELARPAPGSFGELTIEDLEEPER